MNQGRKARYVGTRSHQDVVAGKFIRQDEHGMDNFSDYFTDSEDSESDVSVPASATSSISNRSERRLSSPQNQPDTAKPNHKTSIEPVDRTLDNTLKIPTETTLKTVSKAVVNNGDHTLDSVKALSLTRADSTIDGNAAEKSVRVDASVFAVPLSSRPLSRTLITSGTDLCGSFTEEKPDSAQKVGRYRTKRRITYTEAELERRRTLQAGNPNLSIASTISEVTVVMEESKVDHNQNRLERVLPSSVQSSQQAPAEASAHHEPSLQNSTFEKEKSTNTEKSNNSTFEIDKDSDIEKNKKNSTFEIEDPKKVDPDTEAKTGERRKSSKRNIAKNSTFEVENEAKNSTFEVGKAAKNSTFEVEKEGSSRANGTALDMESNIPNMEITIRTIEVPVSKTTATEEESTKSLSEEENAKKPVSRIPRKLTGKSSVQDKSSRSSRSKSDSSSQDSEFDSKEMNNERKNNRRSKSVPNEESKSSSGTERGRRSSRSSSVPPKDIPSGEETAVPDESSAKTRSILEKKPTKDAKTSKKSQEKEMSGSVLIVESLAREPTKGCETITTKREERGNDEDPERSNAEAAENEVKPRRRSRSSSSREDLREVQKPETGAKAEKRKSINKRTSRKMSVEGSVDEQASQEAERQVAVDEPSEVMASGDASQCGSVAEVEAAFADAVAKTEKTPEKPDQPKIVKPKPKVVPFGDFSDPFNVDEYVQISAAERVKQRRQSNDRRSVLTLSSPMKSNSDTSIASAASKINQSQLTKSVKNESFTESVKHERSVIHERSSLALKDLSIRLHRLPESMISSSLCVDSDDVDNMVMVTEDVAEPRRKSQANRRKSEANKSKKMEKETSIRKSVGDDSRKSIDKDKSLVPEAENVLEISYEELQSDGENSVKKAKEVEKKSKERKSIHQNDKQSIGGRSGKSEEEIPENLGNGLDSQRLSEKSSKVSQSIVSVQRRSKGFDAIVSPKRLSVSSGSDSESRKARYRPRSSSQELMLSLSAQLSQPEVEQPEPLTSHPEVEQPEPRTSQPEVKKPKPSKISKAERRRILQERMKPKTAATDTESDSFCIDLSRRKTALHSLLTEPTEKKEEKRNFIETLKTESRKKGGKQSSNEEESVVVAVPEDNDKPKKKGSKQRKHSKDEEKEKVTEREDVSKDKDSEDLKQPKKRPKKVGTSLDVSDTGQKKRQRKRSKQDDGRKHEEKKDTEMEIDEPQQDVDDIEISFSDRLNVSSMNVDVDEAEPVEQISENPVAVKKSQGKKSEKGAPREQEMIKGKSKKSGPSKASKKPAPVSESESDAFVLNAEAPKRKLRGSKSESDNEAKEVPVPTKRALRGSKSASESESEDKIQKKHDVVEKNVSGTAENDKKGRARSVPSDREKKAGESDSEGTRSRKNVKKNESGATKIQKKRTLRSRSSDREDEEEKEIEEDANFEEVGIEAPETLDFLQTTAERVISEHSTTDTEDKNKDSKRARKNSGRNKKKEQAQILEKPTKKTRSRSLSQEKKNTSAVSANTSEKRFWNRTMEEIHDEEDQEVDELFPVPDFEPVAMATDLRNENLDESKNKKKGGKKKETKKDGGEKTDETKDDEVFVAPSSAVAVPTPKRKSEISRVSKKKLLLSETFLDTSHSGDDGNSTRFDADPSPPMSLVRRKKSTGLSMGRSSLGRGSLGRGSLGRASLGPKSLGRKKSSLQSEPSIAEEDEESIIQPVPKKNKRGLRISDGSEIGTPSNTEPEPRNLKSGPSERKRRSKTPTNETTPPKRRKSVTYSDKLVQSPQMQSTGTPGRSILKRRKALRNNKLLTTKPVKPPRGTETPPSGTALEPPSSGTPLANLTGVMTPGPVHFYQVDDEVETTPVTKPKRKPADKIIKPRSPPGEGVRRSQRTRVLPLAWYKNERIKYSKRKSGGFLISNVLPPITDDETTKKKKKKRTMMGKRHKRLSMHAALSHSVVFADNEGEIPIVYPELGEEVLLDCVATSDQLVYCGPGNAEPSENDQLLIAKPIQQPAFSCGSLIIRGLQAKQRQFVNNDTLIFYVQKGKVAVTIHETTTILDENGIFFVPRGNWYAIKNLRRDDARLTFTQLKNSLVQSSEESSDSDAR